MATSDASSCTASTKNKKKQTTKQDAQCKQQGVLTCCNSFRLELNKGQSEKQCNDVVTNVH